MKERRKRILTGQSSNKTDFLVKIAVLLALTVLSQYLCSLSGQQLLVGSVVNLFLLFGTALCGLLGGMTIGLVTPFIAFLIGINANLAVVPFIALANALYSAIFSLNGLVEGKAYLRYTAKGAAVVIASATKFCFMYFVCVKCVLPLFLAEAAVNTLAVAWGTIQLFTALFGGVLAVLLELAFEKRKLLVSNHSENDGNQPF